MTRKKTPAAAIDPVFKNRMPSRGRKRRGVVIEEAPAVAVSGVVVRSRALRVRTRSMGRDEGGEVEGTDRGVGTGDATAGRRNGPGSRLPGTSLASIDTPCRATAEAGKSIQATE